jgi:hypothetical protein
VIPPGSPRRVGCPIRRSRDQRSLASPPGFSQRAASFLASQCQGIHQMPFATPFPARLSRRAADPCRRAQRPAPVPSDRRQTPAIVDAPDPPRGAALLVKTPSGRTAQRVAAPRARPPRSFTKTPSSPRQTATAPAGPGSRRETRRTATRLRRIPRLTPAGVVPVRGALGVVPLGWWR